MISRAGAPSGPRGDGTVRAVSSPLFTELADGRLAPTWARSWKLGSPFRSAPGRVLF